MYGPKYSARWNFCVVKIHISSLTNRGKLDVIYGRCRFQIRAARIFSFPCERDFFLCGDSRDTLIISAGKESARVRLNFDDYTACEHRRGT